MVSLLSILFIQLSTNCAGCLSVGAIAQMDALSRPAYTEAAYPKLPFHLLKASSGGPVTEIRAQNGRSLRNPEVYKGALTGPLVRGQNKGVAGVASEILGIRKVWEANSNRLGQDRSVRGI
jgi:hypothetical protein